LTATANTDTDVTITGLTNPATGSYGPFGLVTRHYAGGQILDSNAVFGSVGIAAAASGLGNITLSFTTGTSATINASSQSLDFEFTIA